MSENVAKVGTHKRDMKDNPLKHVAVFLCISLCFTVNALFSETNLGQQSIFWVPYVIFNEILANEPGSNTKLEWVELFNADSTDHDLGGWLLASKEHITELRAGTIIPAGGFLVIARKLVAVPPDSISFEWYWGDASGVWGDSELEDFPAVEAMMSLTNSGEEISLTDINHIRRSFLWHEDCGDGTSLEKISPETIERLENWSCCIHPNKSTPGKINSVSPAENDLSIQCDEFFSIPEVPLEDSSFSLMGVVRNTGRAKSLGNELGFFNDRNWDELLTEDERLGGLINIPPLEVDEAETISIEISFPKGDYRIYARIGEDEKDFNNQVFINLKVRGTLPDVVINEFMYNPDLGITQTEWVELYNRTDDPISVRNWLLGDSVEQKLLTPDEVVIEPEGFLIIAQDKNEFQATYPEVNCEIVEQESWQSLNNTGDEVVLKDSLNLLEDQVSYTGTGTEKGISWERIDYDVSSNDENNWWRCVGPEGATPGKHNSIHTHYSSQIELSIAPNPFSPDEDGFEDEVTFKYVLPRMSEFTLRLYDVKGRLVKTLMEDEPQATGEIVWDGRDDTNRIVRVGIYIVLAEAKGITSSVKKTTLVVAKR